MNLFKQPLFKFFHILIFSSMAQIIPAVAQQVPDLTNGGTLPEVSGKLHDWNLGATGARGWIYSDKLVTSDARQIYVTEVATGSPAQNILNVGDVILGVNGSAFTYDPRTELGKALTVAESIAGNGQLSVIRWRNGTQTDEILTLPVLGDYSATSPYSCPKSTAILNQGAAKLALEMAKPSYNPRTIPRALNALALLATGDVNYHPLIRDEVERAADFRTITDRFQTWYYSYNLILVAEYTIATGSQEFVTKMRELALLAADGQSDIGSWGHRFASAEGRLFGYGMMNSPGIPMTTGLALASLAGVDDVAVAEAIEKSAKLLRFYNGKGALPYGDHYPWIQTHDDNGKCGMASVLFDILGEASPATYYSRASVASHGAERDTGHTGNFFNMLWATPGVSRSGPNATGAWMNEFGSWYYDLARQWDGSFRHQGPPQLKGDSYNKWDSSGAYLLSYAMPLKKIYLTGKQTSIVPQLSPVDAAGLIDDGKGWTNKDRTSYYLSLNDNELYQRLGSWSPTVRNRAADALSRRYATPQNRLINLLDDPNLYVRLGACEALAQSGRRASPAISKLRDTLQAEDSWLRVQAANALARIGSAAIAAAPDILTLAVNVDEVNDPRKMEQRFLLMALFSKTGLLKNSLDGVDRALLTDAIIKGLQNQDGRARGDIGNVFEKLTYEEIRPLLPVVLEAVQEPAPSGLMFADRVREEGLKTLLRHNVGDGIQAAVNYLAGQSHWASEHRTPRILETLIGYGTHAQAMIPQLEAIADYFEGGEPNFPFHLSLQKADNIRAAIITIQSLTETPELIWTADIEGPVTADDPLGILTKRTLGTTNPATGVAWKYGDSYRIAFITSDTRNATSTDIDVYNTFVQGVANSSTRGLGAMTWKVVASTSGIDARDNTSTNPNTDGIGVPVFLVDGSSVIAMSNSDLWDGGILSPLLMDENGNTLTTHVNRIFTGSDEDGTKVGNGRVLGNALNIRTGNADKINHSWMREFNQPATNLSRFYALSEPIKLLSIKPIAKTDSDRGGLEDRMEWLYGGDPGSSKDDATITPQLDTTPDANGKVRFSYRLSDAAKNDPGMTIIVQYSHNLTDWIPVAHTGNGPNDVTVEEDDNHYGIGIDRVSVAMPSSMISPAGCLFVRLNVTDN